MIALYHEENLPISKLKELTDICGIQFLAGRNSLQDRPQATVIAILA
jgi:hypothetical protein